MRRFGCLLMLLSVALLWGGGQGLYTAITNWRPTEMAFADYVREKPGAKWLSLGGCSLDLLEAAYAERFGSVEELYIPVRGSRDEEGPIHVVLSTRDPDLRKLVEKAHAITDREKLLAFLAENRDEVVFEKDLRGLVRYGIDLKDEDRTKLASLNEDLSSDFIILDEGEKPSFASSLGIFGGGLLLLVLFVGVSARGGTKPAADPPAEAPASS